MSTSNPTPEQATLITNAQAELNRTKIALMSKPDVAFFTTLVFSLQHKFSFDLPTAATNGKQIRFNPEFFMTLTRDERVFLLVHEAMHVALLHLDRKADKDHRKWNVAADHVINLMLIDRGFKMPQNGLADPKYANLSTEEVYKLLPDNPSPPPMEDLQDPGEGDDDKDKQGDGNGGSGSQISEDVRKAIMEQHRQDVQDILVRAAMQSKMAGDKPGTIPGDIEIFLDKLLNPKLPWNRILQRFVNQKVKEDYSFRKPNRRFMPKHYLPSLYSDGLGEIAIAVDTSGSVSDADFNQFISEIASIFKTTKPKKIQLIQFDTRIHTVTPIKNVNDLKRVKFKGRGGTDVHDLMKWTVQHKPEILLVFTDGFFHECDIKPKGNTSVVWLIHDNPNFTSSLGKVIHYDLNYRNN